MITLGSTKGIEVEFQKVEEIDINGKYIVYVLGDISAELADRIARRLKEWLVTPDEPFFVINSGAAKLVKIDAGEKNDKV